MLRAVGFLLLACTGAGLHIETAHHGFSMKQNKAIEGEPTPMFTEGTMPAVSPTLQCVMNLGIQYFAVYTLLALVRTINNFTSGQFIGLQKILETASTTVTYAPMLSVLFLGTRMRAIQLSQGQTEKYQLPQPWVQQAMFIATWAVLVQVLLVLILPIFTGEMDVKCDEDGNLDTSAMQGGGIVATVVSVVRYAAMAALYGGMITVVVGVFLMEGPKEIWGEEGAPPVSPAVSCTINLTTQFFLVYLAVALAKTYVEILGYPKEEGAANLMKKLQGLLVIAKYTVNMAPMLCILFVGARMRALQMDPKHGNPQKWAQNCFYLCTYSVMIQTLLVIILPLVTDCKADMGATEGDVCFVMENKTLALVIEVVRYICLFALYGGFTAVMVSVFIIEHPTDVSLTPPISPAMQCVMNLTVQYFFIYLVLFLCITAQTLLGESAMLDQIIWIFDGARVTVMFAPMLSMLYIGTRMRALQLTKATDGTIPTTAGPQLWAQEGMFLSTWSVLVQLIMTILVPICTGGGKPELDEEGNTKAPPGAGYWVGVVIDVVKYLSLIAMYGGIVVVMYAVFTMTPETLPPYGKQQNLIPGVGLPSPPTPPTPSF